MDAANGAILKIEEDDDSMRVLVVEDEPKIAAGICAALADAGCRTEIASDGEEAWFRGDTEDYDLVILDLGLPKLDGLAVLKRWRAAGRHMPILVLTARGAWAERVEGIDAGADDYLAKPFHMEELTARVRALIRRSAGHGSATIEVGPLTLDTRQMRVTVDGAVVPLSPLEYRPHRLSPASQGPRRAAGRDHRASLRRR